MKLLIDALFKATLFVGILTAGFFGVFAAAFATILVLQWLAIGLL